MPFADVMQLFYNICQPSRTAAVVTSYMRLDLDKDTKLWLNLLSKRTTYENLPRIQKRYQPAQ